MKIGLVGVGPWGQTLARKVKEAGHEILFHDRGHKTIPTTGLGEFLPWNEMAGWVDAMVVAAPPDITLRAARYAAEKGKAVLATKPFLGAAQILEEVEIKAPFLVDYVHLRSPLFGRLCDHVEDKMGRATPISAEAAFFGDGPERRFDGLFDYGPHALSCMFDVLQAQAAA